MLADIGKKIAETRKTKGLSQDELAELATLNRVTIARYETGKAEPGAQALNRIADALEVTTDELLGREDRITPFIGIVRKSVPIIGSIACGERVTPDTTPEGYADLPDGVRADFALRCKGDSMIPTLRDGDLVLIRAQPEVEPGQIAAINIDGETTLKHVYRQPGGIALIAENPEYAPVYISADADIIIHGLAVGYVRVFE